MNISNERSIEYAMHSSFYFIFFSKKSMQDIKSTAPVDYVQYSF